MKKRFLSIVVVLSLMLTLTSCDTILGKWRIMEVSAGEIIMTQADIDSLGLDPGYIKINKSGSCVVNLLGDEFDGTWTQAEDGRISFSYGEDMTGTAIIDSKAMTMTDAQGSVYTLEK